MQGLQQACSLPSSTIVQILQLACRLLCCPLQTEPPRRSGRGQVPSPKISGLGIGHFGSETFWACLIWDSVAA